MSVEDKVVPVKEVFRLQNADELARAESMYLPTNNMTLGESLENLRSASSRPKSSTSSSRTILTTCWPGIKLRSTSCPRALALTRDTNSLTTLK